MIIIKIAKKEKKVLLYDAKVDANKYTWTRINTKTVKHSEAQKCMKHFPHLENIAVPFYNLYRCQMIFKLLNFKFS